MFHRWSLRFPLAALLTILAAGCGGGGVTTGDALQVAIDATPATGAAPLIVTLKATVDGQRPAAGATYAWNLGDGTTSTEAMPAHTYPAIGDYTVSLVLKAGGKSGHATRPVH